MTIFPFLIVISFDKYLTTLGGNLSQSLCCFQLNNFHHLHNALVQLVRQFHSFNYKYCNILFWFLNIIYNLFFPFIFTYKPYVLLQIYFFIIINPYFPLALLIKSVKSSILYSPSLIVQYQYLFYTYKFCFIFHLLYYWTMFSNHICMIVVYFYPIIYR